MWKYPWVLHEGYTLLDVRKFFIILQNDCEDLAFVVSRRLLKLKRLLHGFCLVHAVVAVIERI